MQRSRSRSRDLPSLFDERAKQSFHVNIIQQLPGPDKSTRRRNSCVQFNDFHISGFVEVSYFVEVEQGQDIDHTVDAKYY